MRDKTKLVKSWIFAQKLGFDSAGYEKHSWAVDEIINLAVDEPDELWKIILDILEQDDSDEILKAVGAGPLEDLMVYHGDMFIDKVEDQSFKSGIFKTAMKSVWLNGNDTKVCARFFKIAGIPQSF